MDSRVPRDDKPSTRQPSVSVWPPVWAGALAPAVLLVGESDIFGWGRAALLNWLDPWAAGTVALLGLLVVGDGARALLRARRLRAPARPVAALSASAADPPRFAEAAGVTRPRRPDAVLAAPVSGTPCLAWRLTVEAYAPWLWGTGDDLELFELLTPSEWRTIHEATDSVPFYLVDASAAVLVDPTDAEWVVEARYWEADAGDPLPAEVEGYLATLEDAKGGAPRWVADLLPPGGGDRLEGLARSLELGVPTAWRFIEVRLDIASPIHVSGPLRYRRSGPEEVGVVHAAFGWRGDGANEPSSRASLVITVGNEASVEADLVSGGALRVAGGLLTLAVGLLTLAGHFGA